MRCIHTPISWLDLERYVLGEASPQQRIAQHLAECEACSAAKQRIIADTRRMPALVMTSVSPRRHRNWRWGLVAIPALAVLLFLLLPLKARQGTNGMKGGETTLTLVRERNGVLLKPTHFALGDRFKAFVSCPPGRQYAQLVVAEGGTLSYPLKASPIECGNQVPLPGAFSLQGGRLRVCVVLTREATQQRVLPDDAICLTLDSAFSP